MATIEFRGRLKLGGTVRSEMRTAPVFRFEDIDVDSREQIPVLGCPVHTVSILFPHKITFRFPIGITFDNQEFAKRLFGNLRWYEARATVVVDNVIKKFGSLGTTPTITAKLIAVSEKELLR